MVSTEASRAAVGSKPESAPSPQRQRNTWLRKLASHYERIRQQYPKDKLLILFDIDGTILDTRYTVLYVLQAFDRTRGTSFFSRLRVGDIRVQEDQIGHLLDQFQTPRERRAEILDWYRKNRWSLEATLESHRPLRGVMEVVRWFQLQPNTFVGLNTGRPESLRLDTLLSLNTLGEEYRVHFDESLLHMNPSDRERGVGGAKAAGLRHFRDIGYRVFAVVDNEPENLRAIAEEDTEHEILLLQAGKVFESKRTRMPPKIIRDRAYDITELIPEKSLPRHVQFVWHGVNNEENLQRFSASDVHWAELDVRRDPASGRLILRHDSFEQSSLQRGERLLTLAACLDRLKEHGRGVKLDLKEDDELVARALELVSTLRFSDSDLWFNGRVEHLREHGFRRIAKTYPTAVIQCPVDFLAPLVISAPKKAKEILDMLGEWGINRFSVSWMMPDRGSVLEQMASWDFEVNIYNVPNLESFLQAVLLLPRSITADFNFPKWNYYGTGSGENLRRHRYATRRAVTVSNVGPDLASPHVS